MTGIRVNLPRGTRIKDGKVKLPLPVYRDASAAIRAKKSKKQRVVRRTP